MSPELDHSEFFLLPREAEVVERLSTFQLFEEPNVSPTPLEIARQQVGKAWFFDPRFSQNGKIACATCHQPNKNFSDGVPVAQGIGQGARRTPSLLNVNFSHWFFWDGRADSLEAQALGPIEHPLEHGSNRMHVIHILRMWYREAYEVTFGPWPELLSGALPSDAMPQCDPLSLSPKIATYALASFQSASQLHEILRTAERLHQPVWQRVSAHTVSAASSTPKIWVEAWNQLTEETQHAVNQVFANFGRGIAAYERTLLAVDSPFDAFVQRAQKETPITQALTPQFSMREYEGLRLFLGAQCHNCHSGPFFSDQQFHNIGLPLKKGEARMDIGRAAGTILAQSEKLFSCKGPYLDAKSPSCDELDYLDRDNLEMVGAFKTPSLRNVAERAPYGHDGRFPTLQSILEHYNELPDEAGIGHREETLRPLGFSPLQLKQLEAFLRSLSSPTSDVHSHLGLQGEKD